MLVYGKGSTYNHYSTTGDLYETDIVKDENGKTWKKGGLSGALNDLPEGITLKYVVFGNFITEIGERTLSDFTFVESIEFGTGLQKLNKNALHYMSNGAKLYNIYFAGDCPEMDSEAIFISTKSMRMVRRLSERDSRVSSPSPTTSTRTAGPRTALPISTS
jgi:hypothetical protein